MKTEIIVVSVQKEKYHLQLASPDKPVSNGEPKQTVRIQLHVMPCQTKIREMQKQPQQQRV